MGMTLDDEREMRANGITNIEIKHIKQLYENRLKADMAAILDKLRAEIKYHSEHFINDDGEDCLALYEDDVEDILDKYIAESEE